MSLKFLKNEYLITSLVLIAMLMAFFNQQLFNNRTLVPLGILNEFDLVFKNESLSQNYLLSDIVNQFYPNYSLIQQSISSGEFPFWNPYILGGIPFFADSQVSIFEFSHLLAYIFNVSPLSYPLFSAMILLFMLGLSFFIYLRNLKIDKLVALFGSVALMFSGTTIVWLNYPLMTPFIWLPLALFCVDKIVLDKKLIFVTCLTILVCLMLLAGYPQITLINLIIIVLYFLARLFQVKKFRIKNTIVLIVFIFLGLGMSMIQIGPSWELIKESNSYEVGRGYIAQDNFITVAKEQFSNFFDNLNIGFNKALSYGVLAFHPEYYGSPVDRDYKNPENDPYANFSEVTIYSGILTILLAIASLIFIRKNKIIIFWTLTSIISFSLAANLPFFNLLKYLPLINKISASRFRLIFIFSIILLAVHSLQQIFNYLKRKNIKVARALIIIITLITFLDLLYFFSDYNLGIKKDDIFLKENAAINFLKENTKHERIIGLGLLDNGFRSPLIPNTSMLYGLYDVRGYNPIVDKKYINFSDKYLTRRGSFVLADAVFNEKVIDLMNVKYIICPKSGCLVIKQDEEWQREYENNNVDIFKNPSFLPRAYVAYNFINTQNSDEAIQLIEAEDFNPYSQIIVNDFDIKNENLEIDSKKLIQEAEIIEYSNNKVLIKVKSGNKGILVLSDTYNDGWRVRVNDQKKEILLVNGIFRGVIVPEGESEIVFSYRPQHFNIYLFISILSLISLLIATTLINRKSAKHH